MKEIEGRALSGSRYSVPVAIAMGVMGLVLLPVLFPVAMAQLAWERRRVQRAARQMACTVCGERLGDGALERAEVLWGEHVAQLRRDHPHVIFRLVRPYDAVCVACGAEYKWQDETRAFQLVKSNSET